MMEQGPKSHLPTQNPGFPPLTVSITLFTLKTIFSTHLSSQSQEGGSAQTQVEGMDLVREAVQPLS